MQGYSFDTYKSHGGNQEALDACRAIASLSWEPGRAVLLVGPEGSGKSHLLWSMVKQVRARPEKIGLALIMAHEFPDKVKNLVRDPAPIQGARQAMLLVDGLESFREEADMLEAVVRTFLSNGGHVVLTSDVYPDRLLRLSPQFRALLKSGEVIEMRAAPVQSQDTPGDGDREAALKREVDVLRAERDRLDRRLAESAVSSTEVESLRALVRSGLVEQDRLREELEAALKRCAAIAEEAAEERDALAYERDALKSAREEQVPLRAHEAAEEEQQQQQRETLEAKLLEAGNALEVLRSECATLRTQLVVAESALAAARVAEGAAQEEAESALAEQARLQGRLGRMDELELLLEAAHAERDAALEGNRRLADHAEAVLQQIERKKSELTDTQQGLLASFQQLLYDFHAHGLAAGGVVDRDRLQALLGDADNLADAFRRQMAVDRERFEDQIERVRGEGDYASKMLEAARAEQGRLRVALDRAAGRIEALERELAKARRQLALQVAEMDALRQEAASQVARVQSQAGEMEARMASLQSGVESAREAGGVIAHLAERLGGFAAFVEELRDFTGKWAKLRDLAPELPASAAEESTDNQPTLFEAFEALPEHSGPRPITQRATAPPEHVEVPPSLVDLVEEAFAPDADERRPR